MMRPLKKVKARFLTSWPLTESFYLLSLSSSFKEEINGLLGIDISMKVIMRLKVDGNRAIGDKVSWMSWLSLSMYVAWLLTSQTLKHYINAFLFRFNVINNLYIIVVNYFILLIRLEAKYLFSGL